MVLKTWDGKALLVPEKWTIPDKWIKTFLIILVFLIVGWAIVGGSGGNRAGCTKRVVLSDGVHTVPCHSPLGEAQR